MADFKFPGNAASPARGSSRDIDASLDPTSLSSLDVMRFRGGYRLSGLGANGSCVWGFHAGRQCVIAPSGIGYGYFNQFCLIPTIQKPANKGALALRSGISRLITSMACGDLSGVSNPNSDIGVDCLIGIPSGISDLRTNNNTHLPGSSGFGVILRPAGWNFVVKQPDTGSGVFSEDLTLPAAVQTALNSGEYSDIEFRIHDATASQEAKMELWINGVKTLTRYWVGGTDPLLPPMGIAGAGVTGTCLVLQLRNTSTGPPAMYFAEYALIQGPDDAGTL